MSWKVDKGVLKAASEIVSKPLVWHDNALMCARALIQLEAEGLICSERRGDAGERRNIIERRGDGRRA